MGKPANNNKGNSGNTNGGTETSFRNTPQAKDDVISSESFGELNYDSLSYSLDVLANDLGGNAKWLWSVDDGINQSGAMDGYEAGDLLEQDFAGGIERQSSPQRHVLRCFPRPRCSADSQLRDTNPAAPVWPGGRPSWLPTRNPEPICI